MLPVGNCSIDIDYNEKLIDLRTLLRKRKGLPTEPSIPVIFINMASSNGGTNGGAKGKGGTGIKVIIVGAGT